VTHPLFSFYFSRPNGQANRKEHIENNNDNYKTPSMQAKVRCRMKIFSQLGVFLVVMNFAGKFGVCCPLV
jgi:hypothetical protein